jgi:hypothetical protein
MAKKLVRKKSYYGESTAKWMRILGDFLNYAGSAAAISSVVQNYHVAAITFIILGAAGKAITNGWTEQNDEQTEVERNAEGGC